MWKDETIYTQSDTERAPRSWAAVSSKGFRVLVHRIHFYPDKWFVSCNSLGLERRALKSVTAADAKAEAMRVCSARIKALTSAIAEISAFPTT